MTLKRMKGQRRQHQVGDIFVLQLEHDASFRYGRIIKIGTPTREARFPGGLLAYVYTPAFTTLATGNPSLTPDMLLMPPLFTHGWMWHHGYFRTVSYEPLEDSDLIPQHCFYSAHHDWYVDENDRLLRRRYEPCGWFSLATLPDFESELASALGGNPVSGRIGTRPQGTSDEEDPGRP